MTFCIEGKKREYNHLVAVKDLKLVHLIDRKTKRYFSDPLNIIKRDKRDSESEYDSIKVSELTDEELKKGVITVQRWEELISNDHQDSNIYQIEERLKQLGIPITLPPRDEIEDY